MHLLHYFSITNYQILLETNIVQLLENLKLLAETERFKHFFQKLLNDTAFTAQNDKYLQEEIVKCSQKYRLYAKY